MKTGILNVQWLSNYGSVLIAYAMQKVLDKMGIDNEIIDFKPEMPDEKGEIPSAHKEEKLSSAEKTARFELFRRNYLRRSEPLIGTKDAGRLNYDGYIVGSDTVWTPLKVNDIEAEMFYLSFLKDKQARRISWSASIGSDAVSDLDMMRPILKERLRNFDYISVRERETTQYVQTLTEKKVFHTIDPVLMLDKEDYYDILPGTGGLEEKYIYAFLFNDPGNSIETVNKLSRKTGLPVAANVKSDDKTDNIIVNTENDGPSEFVQRIFNAEYIITDSYHGAIFSILANKPFLCYTREGSEVRARNLLEDLGLKERFITSEKNGADIIMSGIDYKAVFEKITAWCECTAGYLNKALGGHQKFC